MEAKKTASANLENKKGLFTLLGFVVVLGFMYIFFEWAEKEVEVYTDNSTEVFTEEEEMMVQTQQQVAPPPPAPEVPVEIPPEIKVTDGSLTIGVRYKCNKNSWGTLDDVTLYKIAE